MKYFNHGIALILLCPLQRSVFLPTIIVVFKTEPSQLHLQTTPPSTHTHINHSHIHARAHPYPPVQQPANDAKWWSVSKSTSSALMWALALPEPASLMSLEKSRPWPHRISSCGSLSAAMLPIMYAFESFGAHNVFCYHPTSQFTKCLPTALPLGTIHD